jgi:hypothetical protein
MVKKKATEPKDRFLSVAEASDITGLHITRIRYLIREGRIKAVRGFANIWLILPSDLANYKPRPRGRVKGFRYPKIPLSEISPKKK